MKKLILILATSISLFSCKKKEEVKPQTTTTTQKSTPIVTPSNCNKDSTWTRTHPKLEGSLYTFKENCTHITISWKFAKITLTLLKPIGTEIVTNYKNITEYDNDPDPNKIYYYLYKGKNVIIYDVKEKGRYGVSGPGMKIQ